MVAMLLACLLPSAEGGLDAPIGDPPATAAPWTDSVVAGPADPSASERSGSPETDSVASPEGRSELPFVGPVTVLPGTVVRGKSRARRVEESGYSVEVVRTREAKARSGDVQDLVAATSGVVVREEGGLGSGSDLALNGMSGKHVRVFLDGVPIEQLGTGLELGDLPPNAVQSIEVYKGVVPIHLGADALGGAIDVRTLPDPRTFLDASWSWGSFGTHRGSLNGLWRADSLPIAVRLNAYHNRSDNDYGIDWKLTDPETGKYGPERSFRRFHDGYSSTWGNAEAGLVGTPFADQLWMGVSAGRSDKEIQHGNSLDRVYGEVERRSESVQANARWEKDGIVLPGISARAWVSAGSTTTELVDTSSLKYDWTGVGQTRNSGNGNGEALWYKTHYRIEEATRTGFADVRWTIAEDNHLEASWTGTGYESEWKDLRDATWFPPTSIAKNVSGLSFRRDLFERRLSATVFGKSYLQTATVQTLSSYANEADALVEKDVSETGFGAAVSWKPWRGVLLKTSFEDAVRLQEPSELLGDGLLLRANPDLRPERSLNVNAGLQAEGGSEVHRFRGEVGGFGRELTDKVRLNAEGATSRYENVGRVRIVGVEGDAAWTGWDVVETGLNATWQRARDRTPGSVTYDVQLPNTPIVFGNARLSAKWDRPWGRDVSLRAAWGLHHVREYFLYWPLFGDEETKNRIPSQWTQSAGAVVDVLDGRLSWSVDCANLTDAKAYDDWRKQKPGRSWSTKLRLSL